MRRLILMAGATLIMACESDDAKLRRLQHEEALAGLHAMVFHNQPWPSGLTPDQSRARQDSIDAADRAVVLSRRALEKFMAGR